MGYGYDGQDPNASGCASGAYTIQSWPVEKNRYRNNSIGTIELRASDSCGTNWIRVTTNVGAVLQEKYLGRAKGDHTSADSTLIIDNDQTSSSSYGRMIYAPGSTCVNVYVAVMTPDGSTLLGDNDVYYPC